MMPYHVLCHVGPADSFTPSLQDGEAVYRVTFQIPDSRDAVRSNIAEEMQRRGLAPSPVILDLLRLAMTVYAADTGIPRSSGYDGWTRDLAIHLPVSDAPLWSTAIPGVAAMLEFLTGDHWSLDCRPLASTAADDQGKPGSILQPDAVTLFSGGLDSFAGTIECLAQGQSLVLVGHHGMGTTNKAQERAHAAVTAAYPDRTALLPFYVQGPPPLGKEPERTTRARSLLFLALGSAVAAAIKPGLPLLVPENGLISLNPPLTDSRTGSFSTRTTHPHFIALYRQLLASLGIGLPLNLPYRFLTKGEMLLRVLDAAGFREGLPATVSCSHPDVGRYKGTSPGQHCGYCVPCIIRRASLHAVGLDDPSQYLVDVRTNPPPLSSDTSRDIRAFQIAVDRFADASRRDHLLAVLATGPIPPDEVPEYVAVYERGMREVQQFLTVPA